MSDSHDFCRLLLSVTRKDLTAEQRKRLVGAWSYQYKSRSVVDSGEFTVPADRACDTFYWHGSACCAYSARVNGINAWLQKFYPEQEVES